MDAILNQTYKNLEIIIINNGADDEITSYINDLAQRDKRIVVIRYEKNIFSFDDPMLTMFTVGNDALKKAKGDYVFYQSYDDLLALDYVEKMVKLFKDNPKCTTAAGRYVSIDVNGEVDKEELHNRGTNFRPRYMPGHLLALDTLKPNSVMFAAPGTIFSIKRDIFLKYGGFCRAVEAGQFFGIVPFGVTGFDETACFYWRRHEGQLNRELVARGHVGSSELFQMLKDNEIEKRWNVYGRDTAKWVVKHILKRQCRGAAMWFVHNFFDCRVKACLRITRDTGHKCYYWACMPAEMWKCRHIVRRKVIYQFTRMLGKQKYE
ncbi:MAG: glycosyltransferase family 2 protein [Candidatus Omnitrophota bacterium]